METATVLGNAPLKLRTRNFAGVVHESIDFEEDYDLPSDEDEVRRLIKLNGMIGVDSNIGELL